MTWEIGVQSHIESYKKKTPCLTLNIINYGLSVSEAIQGKELLPTYTSVY